MANTALDFDRLIDFIKSLGASCRAALEPTGEYHRPVAHRLISVGIEVVSISSVAQSRMREAIFNSWNKNDPKDASVMLEMLKQGRVQTYVKPTMAGNHNLQELSKTYTKCRAPEPKSSIPPSTTTCRFISRKCNTVHSVT